MDYDKPIEMKPNCIGCHHIHPDNGNCTAVGGFCTAVPAAHCPLIPELRADLARVTAERDAAEVDACPVCRGTGAVPAARTHGDSIRAMGDEELAAMLNRFAESENAPHYCRNLPECDVDMEADRLIPLERCQACLLYWLQQPAEGDVSDAR